ncbi:hypothetical protein CEXT_553951 [Caerostris extrusa]|uniref:Uncharacterized protein n=1 Tax=Caerostris extrusa TaxID=172846 RepID=A0AAV4P7L3_CAEEX|nr:hypothetical protein CEXT_553951 [Caerostris extrusa]
MKHAGNFTSLWKMASLRTELLSALFPINLKRGQIKEIFNLWLKTIAFTLYLVFMSVLALRLWRERCLLKWCMLSHACGTGPEVYDPFQIVI